MSQAPTQPSSQPQAQGAPAPGGAQGGGPAVQRQFVNFAFYKLDPAFRRLGEHDKIQARSEFFSLFQQRRQGLMCLTYSTVGLKAECDFMLWRIGLSPDAFQEQSKAMNKTRLGAYLTQPYNFVAMTKRSMYIDKLDPFHTAESRTHIIPGKRKYLFVYPFVKTRDWYLLPLEQRQAIMDVHIKVGHEFPTVRINTAYSFGLDDQEFVVAFETDYPSDFLDLVQELRESKASRYTLRDTPMFTCRQLQLGECLDELG